ncbi:hypothetical protein EDD16DRAFT_1589870 [Pisolithus croceorrhizus]|nr:hypothetical protein EDD16DRAFT_1589870 [Pisolithus croceorrhizus]
MNPHRCTEKSVLGSSNATGRQGTGHGVKLTIEIMPASQSSCSLSRFRKLCPDAPLSFEISRPPGDRFRSKRQPHKDADSATGHSFWKALVNLSRISNLLPGSRTSGEEFFILILRCNDLSEPVATASCSQLTPFSFSDAKTHESRPCDSTPTRSFTDSRAICRSGSGGDNCLPLTISGGIFTSAADSAAT